MRGFLLFLFLCAFGFSSAQKDVGGFFQLSIGAGMPQGDFASKDIKNPAAGYARNGLSTSLLFGHKIHKQWGGFVQLNLAANAIDRQAYAQYLSDSYSNRVDWSGDIAFWSLSGFTFGPQFSQNFKRSALDIRVGLGALNFFMPELNYIGKSESTGEEWTYKQYEARSSAATLGFGLSFKYELKWSWVILANMDTYTALAVFNEVEREIKPHNATMVNETVNFSKSFRLFHAGLGLGYVF